METVGVLFFLSGAGFPFQLKSLLSIRGTALKNNSWVDFCSLFDTPVVLKVKTSHLNILRDVFFKIYIVSIFYVSSNPPNIILKKRACWFNFVRLRFWTIHKKKTYQQFIISLGSHRFWLDDDEFSSVNSWFLPSFHEYLVFKHWQFIDKCRARRTV